MRFWFFTLALFAGCASRHSVPELPVAAPCEEPFVLVLGEVKNPGRVRVRPGLDVRGALADSGGLTPLARPWQTILARRAADGRSVRVLVGSILLGEEEDVPLAACDVLHVRSGGE